MSRRVVRILRDRGLVLRLPAALQVGVGDVQAVLVDAHVAAAVRPGSRSRPSRRVPRQRCACCAAAVPVRVTGARSSAADAAPDMVRCCIGVSQRPFAAFAVPPPDCPANATVAANTAPTSTRPAKTVRLMRCLPPQGPRFRGTLSRVSATRRPGRTGIGSPLDPPLTGVESAIRPEGGLRMVRRALCVVLPALAMLAYTAVAQADEYSLSYCQRSATCRDPHKNIGVNGDYVGPRRAGGPVHLQPPRERRRATSRTRSAAQEPAGRGRSRTAPAAPGTSSCARRSGSA